MSRHPPLRADARASSADGVEFAFAAELSGFSSTVGSYVEVGGGRLGQITTAGLTSDLAGPTDAARHDPAVVRGHGVVLDGPVTSFHDELLVPASSAALSAWLGRVRTATARLDVARLLLEPSIRLPLDAAGFDRHTFLCGQSGSGKTYALGTVLEQLLMETTLRIVVLDPNSDFVGLGRPRTSTPPELRERYSRAASAVEVRGAAGSDGQRLHVRFLDCDRGEQAAVLRLDPVADRHEYGALIDALDSDGPTGVDATEVMRRLLESPEPPVQALGARMRSLGIDRWQIWSGSQTGSLQDLVGPDGPRCLVVDTGSLGTAEEQGFACEAVLAALWRRRADRTPVLLVIDEAHNVCPATPADPISALATELVARIAAEGRKFGLYLLVSTQRPQRVHELVVSQCDNAIVMRMNAASDLAYLAETLSFVPASLLTRARRFRQGESVVAGKIASHPTLVQFGPRVSEEGGSDVPTDWTASPHVPSARRSPTGDEARSGGKGQAGK